MGRSLHKVEMKFIKGTGAFASQDGAKQQTFREEYILPYSLILFYGIVNENAAKKTGLTDDDVKDLKLGLWDGTKNLISRSKFEHNPKLLIEVKYKEDNFFIGELDKYISFDSELQDEKIRDITDGNVNLTNLATILAKYEDKIESIEIKKSDRIEIIGIDVEKIKGKIKWI
jgi:CRISPR-associated protein Csh2